MLATQAAERELSGYPEMSVFHGLLAGNVGHAPVGGRVVVVVVVVGGSQAVTTPTARHATRPRARPRIIERILVLRPISGSA
jgi:hypothetical protein